MRAPAARLRSLALFALGLLASSSVLVVSGDARASGIIYQSHILEAQCDIPFPATQETGPTPLSHVGSDPGGGTLYPRGTASWDIHVAPSQSTAEIFVSRTPGALAASCIEWGMTVQASDLIISSVGGVGSTVQARMNFSIAATYTLGASDPATAVNASWALGSSDGTFLGILAASGSGFQSVCLSTPWMTLPVGSAFAVRYTMFNRLTAAYGSEGGVFNMTPGCSPFVEIQQAGFTYDSAELGIVNGAFVPVPEPATAGLLLSGLLGFALRRRA